jgi:Holliday junction resolvase
MVDSRMKGQRGEYLVRDMLREATGLSFERVPASGALSYLKGDLYIPDAKNAYCIEVKNYESRLTILQTGGKRLYNRQDLNYRSLFCFLSIRDLRFM